MTRDILNQVRELLERNLDIVSISQKMNIDIETVRAAADTIKELTT